MSTHQVLQLEAYRDRRERRFERALALYGADAERARLVRHLWVAASVGGGDRAAVVWVDEYGPGLAHTHVILDLASDLPRRAFSVEPLRLAWSGGVPGLYDLPEKQGVNRFSEQGSSRSLCAVALGSDGLRAWFLVVDGQTPRAPLSEEDSGWLMFVAGECSAILMHRDMGRSGETILVPEGGHDRFSAWPVLKDIEGREAEEEANRRISCRFLVARVVRALVDDDLSPDREGLEHQIEAVRREIRTGHEEDPERRLWEEVLDALESEDGLSLSRSLLSLGNHIEGMAHFSGARELYRSAYEIAMAVGADALALEAARLGGRSCRRQAKWDDALAWYAVARSLALAVGEKGKEAVVLDGMSIVYRERGNFPRAREALQEALAAATESGDAYATASVYHQMMVLASHSGDHDRAVRYGWKAVQTHERDEDRLVSLTGLAASFLSLGELRAAEDAYAVVAKRVGLLEYRLYALSGYAQVAAHRGDRAEFQRRIGILEAAGFEDGSPTFRAEALVELGHASRKLGQVAEAERRYRRALAIAEEQGLNEYLFQAEEALEVLASGVDRDEHERNPSASTPSAETTEIGGEVGMMRVAAGAAL